MAYTVSFEEEAGYVLLTLSGEVGFDELAASRDDAVALLKELGCFNLLIDATREIPQQQPVVEDYEFTANLGDHVPPGTRQAVVVKASEGEYMQFVENVAQNRGVDLNVFIDRDEALAWLLNE